MSMGHCKDCGVEVEYNNDGYGSPQCESCWKKEKILSGEIGTGKESDAVKFGEWLLKGVGMRWCQGGAQWIIGMRSFTTAEAYELFHAEQKEKK